MIVCAGVVLASIDLFVVNVALPDIARDLHQPNLGDLSWVLNGYAIVYASLLVVFGRLAEGRSRDAGFLLGVLIFTLASAACGLASSLAMLVGFRIVQAAGAALLTPTSLSLVLATTNPERRHGAVRGWTAVGGAAAALGPVLGGLLVAVGWRWVFYVNVPIGLAALAIGWRRLRHVPGHPVPAPDALGAALITAGIGALTLGLVEGNDWGWGSTRVLAALAVAAIMLAGFVARTLRHHNPLIDPRLFRIREFTGSSAVALDLLDGVRRDAPVDRPVDAAGVGVVGARNRPGVRSGPADGARVRFPDHRAADRALRSRARHRPRRQRLRDRRRVVGAARRARPDYVGQVLPGTLLTGAGVGLTLPTFMATGASSLPPQSFATGSAAVNMLRQVGLAVGVAVFVAVLGSPQTPAASLTAFQRGWIVIACVAAGAALTGAALLGAGRPRAVAARRGAVAVTAAED